MGYTSRLRGGAGVFDGTADVSPSRWYFPKGGSFAVSGSPTYGELAAAISEAVHVCGRDVFLGGSMPETCGGVCLGVNATPTGVSTVLPDGTTVVYAAGAVGAYATGIAVVAVLALAAFLGISAEITAAAAAGAARPPPIVIRYGGVIKDVGLLIAFQIMWNETVSLAPHPFLAVVFESHAVYHGVHFATAAVASGIVAGAFNRGRLFAVGGTSRVGLGHALLGRAAFETICLLGVGVVGPIMPAVQFAAVIQLAVGLAMTAITVRDVCAARLLCPQLPLGAALAGDLLLLLAVGSGALLALPFCVDATAVPVGLEVTVAVALVLQVGAAAAVYVGTVWAPHDGVDGGGGGRGAAALVARVGGDHGAHD